MEKVEQKNEGMSAHKEEKSNVLTYLLVGLVVGLMLFSAVQTFQIGSLEKSVFAGATAGSSVASPSSSSRTGGAAVPAMVGGC